MSPLWRGPGNIYAYSMQYDRLLLKQQLFSPFPVRGQQRWFYARAASIKYRMRQAEPCHQILGEVARRFLKHLSSSPVNNNNSNKDNTLQWIPATTGLLVMMPALSKRQQLPTVLTDQSPTPQPVHSSAEL